MNHFSHLARINTYSLISILLLATRLVSFYIIYVVRVCVGVLKGTKNARFSVLSCSCAKIYSEPS